MSLRLLHRVAGIAVALPLAVTACSGVVLLARGPYYRARFPVLAQPVTRDQLERRGQIMDRIDAMFSPAAARTVKLPRAGFNGLHVYLTDGSEALVDPVSGVVLDRWRWSTRPFPFLFELHAHLLAGPTGKAVNGVAAAGAIGLACSGLWLWWSGRRNLDVRRVIPPDGSRGSLLRSHAATGVLTAVPLLCFTATGAAIVFYEPVGRVMSAAFDRRPPVVPDAVVAPTGCAQRPWSAIFAAAEAAFGGVAPAMVSPGTRANAAVTFRTRLPGEWHPNGRSYVLVHPCDASVVQAIDARTQGAGTRAMYAMYPVHSAAVGGGLMIALGVCGGGGLIWLGVGGGLLTVLRRRPGGKRRRSSECAGGPASAPTRSRW